MSGVLKKQRVYELDYIRAISAIFIVLFHYTTQYNNSIGHIGSWPVSVPWGSMAVNTFFLLTGYLTVCHYSSGFLQFVYKRWCRLWPAFAVCVIITSAFMALLMPERLRTIPDILINFTMFPAYLGAKAVDGVYWTLPVEIIFYFWIAVILCLTKKRKKLLMICLYGWTVLSIIVSLFSKLNFLPLPTSLLQIGFNTLHAPCFIIGIAIFLQNADDGVSWKSTLPLLFLCVAGVYLGRGLSLTVWTTLWALLIWAVTAGKLHFSLKKKNPVHKCLVFLAGISYPLYLLHQFIGFAIIQKLEHLGAVNELWIIVPIVFSILLATAVHYWVEIPAGNLLLKLLKKKAPTQNNTQTQ